jgi:DNA invertase Pin-like site-specific DNA recombinase
MDAIIYAAKSSADPHGSIDAQLKDGRSLCEEDGLTVRGEYHEEAKSAYSGSRGEELERAKEHAARLAAENGEEVALVVQHTDRLARGDGVAAAHLVEVALWARKHGVRIRSKQDDSTGENLLMAVVMGERNHEDSKRKSAAVKSGKQRAFERGDWPGGPVPDGLKLSARGPDDKRKPEPDEERAPVIRRMAALADEGMSWGAVARKLNAEGHRTKDGLPWTGKRVHDTLSNPVYAGRVVIYRRSPRERIGDGSWEPLIDPELFDRLGVKATLRHRQSKGGRPTSRYALSGLAVCDRCGRPMYGRQSHHTRKDGTKRRDYLCASRMSKTGTCDSSAFDARRIDAAVIAHLSDLFIDFEKWAEEQAQAGERQRAVFEREVGRLKKEATLWARRKETARLKYIEKQSRLREDVLEHCTAEADAAKGRAAEAQHRLDAAPTETPTDAMLDAYNALRHVLEEDAAPLNERLKRIFDEFRIGLVDGDTIAVLPVLRPDVIETHADPSGAVKVVSDEGSRLISPPAGSDTSASSVMLLVQPPVTPVAIPGVVGTGCHAGAWGPPSVGTSEGYTSLPWIA